MLQEEKDFHTYVLSNALQTNELLLLELQKTFALLTNSKNSNLHSSNSIELGEQAMHEINVKMSKLKNGLDFLNNREASRITIADVQAAMEV